LLRRLHLYIVEYPVHDSLQIAPQLRQPRRRAAAGETSPLLMAGIAARGHCGVAKIFGSPFDGRKKLGSGRRAPLPRRAQRGRRSSFRHQVNSVAEGWKIRSGARRAFVWQTKNVRWLISLYGGLRQRGGGLARIAKFNPLSAAAAFSLSVGRCCCPACRSPG